MTMVGKTHRQPAGSETPLEGREAKRPKALRLPDYVAMLGAGIAAILKVVLPGAVHIRNGLTSDTSPTTEADRTTEACTQSPSECAVNDGEDGGICDLSAPDIGFILPDHGLLSYAAASGSFGNKLAAYFPAAFGYLPQNDNLPRTNPCVHDAEALLPRAPASADLAAPAFMARYTGEPQDGNAGHGAQADAAADAASQAENRPANGGPTIDQASCHRAARLADERSGALHHGSNPDVPTGTTFGFRDDTHQTMVNAGPARDNFYKSGIMLEGIQLPLSIANIVA